MTSDLAFAGQEVDDICSKEELVNFHNVSPVYNPEDPITVHYTLGTQVVATCQDWVGVFLSGWNDTSQPLAFLRTPPPPQNGAKSRRRSVTFSPDLTKRLENNEKCYQCVYVVGNDHVMGVSQSFQIKREELWCDDIDVLANQHSPSVKPSVKESDQIDDSAASVSPFVLSSDEEWEMATQSTMKYYGSSTSDLSDIIILSTSPSKEAAKMQNEANASLEANLNSTCHKNQGSNETPDTILDLSSDEEFVVSDGSEERNASQKDTLKTDSAQKKIIDVSTFQKDISSTMISGIETTKESDFEVREFERAEKIEQPPKQKDLKIDRVSRKVRQKKRQPNSKEDRDAFIEDKKKEDIDSLDGSYDSLPCRPSLFSQLKIIDSSDEEGFGLKESLEKAKIGKKCKIEIISETSKGTLHSKTTKDYKRNKTKRLKKLKTTKGDHAKGVLPLGNTTCVRNPAVLFDELEDFAVENPTVSSAEIDQPVIKELSTMKTKPDSLERKTEVSKRKNKSHITVPPRNDNPALLSSEHFKSPDLSLGFVQNQKLAAYSLGKRDHCLKRPNQEMRELKRKYKLSQKAKSKKARRAQAREKALVTCSLAFLFDSEMQSASEEVHGLRVSPAEAANSSKMIQESSGINNVVLTETSKKGFPALLDSKEKIVFSKETRNSVQSANSTTWSGVFKPDLQEASRESEQDVERGLPNGQLTGEAPKLSEKTAKDVSQSIHVVDAGLTDEGNIDQPSFCNTKHDTLKNEVAKENSINKDKKDLSSGKSIDAEDNYLSQDVPYVPAYVLDIMDALPPSISVPADPYKSLRDWKKIFSPLINGLPSSKFKAKYKYRRRQEFRSIKLRRKLGTNMDNGIIDKIMKTRFPGEIDEHHDQTSLASNMPTEATAIDETDSNIQKPTDPVISQEDTTKQKTPVVSDLFDFPALPCNTICPEKQETDLPVLSYAGVLKKSDCADLSRPEDVCIVDIESTAPLQETGDSGVDSYSADVSEVPTKQPNAMSRSSTTTTAVASNEATNVVFSEIQMLPFKPLDTPVKTETHQSETLRWPKPTFIKLSCDGKSSQELSSQLLTASFDRSSTRSSPSSGLELITSIAESDSKSMLSKGENLGPYLRPNARIHCNLNGGWPAHPSLLENIVACAKDKNCFKGDSSSASSPCGEDILGSYLEATATEEEQIAVLDLALSASLTENRELRNKLECKSAKLAELAEALEECEKKQRKSSARTSQTAPIHQNAVRKKVAAKRTLKRKVPVVKWKAGHTTDVIKANGELLSLRSKVKDADKEIISMQIQINALKEAFQIESEVKMKTLFQCSKLKQKVKVMRHRLRELGVLDDLSIALGPTDFLSEKIEDNGEAIKAMNVKSSESNTREDYEPQAKKRKLDEAKSTYVISNSTSSQHHIGLSNRNGMNTEVDGLPVSSLREASCATVKCQCCLAPSQGSGKDPKIISSDTHSRILPTKQSLKDQTSFYCPLQKINRSSTEHGLTIPCFCTNPPSAFPPENHVDQSSFGNFIFEKADDLQPRLKPQDLRQVEHSIGQEHSCSSDRLSRGRRKQSPPHLPLPTPKKGTQYNEIYSQSNSPQLEARCSVLPQQRQYPVSSSMKASNALMYQPHKPFSTTMPQASPKQSPPHLPLPPPTSSPRENQRNGQWADRSHTLPSPNSRIYPYAFCNQTPKSSNHRDFCLQTPSVHPHSEREDVLQPPLWLPETSLDSHSHIQPDIHPNLCVRKPRTDVSTFFHQLPPPPLQLLPVDDIFWPDRIVNPSPEYRSATAKDIGKYFESKKDLNAETSFLYQDILGSAPYHGQSNSEQVSSSGLLSDAVKGKRNQQSVFSFTGKNEYQPRPESQERLPDKVARPWFVQDLHRAFEEPPPAPCRNPYAVCSSEHDEFFGKNYLPFKDPATSILEGEVVSDTKKVDFNKAEAMAFLFPQNPLIDVDGFLAPPAQDKSRVCPVPCKPLSRKQESQQVQHQGEDHGQRGLRAHGPWVPNNDLCRSQSSNFFELSTGGLIDASETCRDGRAKPDSLYSTVCNNAFNPGLIEARVAHQRNTTKS